MIEHLLIQPLKSENMRVSTPYGDDRVSDTVWLAKEFAPTQVEQFGKKLRTLLETTGDLVASDPEKFPRGGEIFRVENGSGKVIAVAMSKYYAWNLLKKQLCFQVHQDEQGNLVSLSLNTFGELTGATLEKADFSLAVELAYNLVDVEYRGQGLGAKMFAHRMARAICIQTNKPKLLFTIARGTHLVEKTGKHILSYMLDKERETNGEYPDGRAIVTGITISANEIRTDMRLPNKFIFEEVSANSHPIVKLAQKAEMVQAGLFNTLSPIFAATLK